MTFILLCISTAALVVLILRQRQIHGQTSVGLPVSPAADDQRFSEALIEAIPCPVFYKGRDGRYLGCNSAFADYLGRHRDEIVGRSVYDLSPKHLADRYAAADAALFAAGGTQVYEVKVQWADGSLRDVIMHKAAFARADEPIGGLIGVIADITDRKRAEEEVLRLKEALERRVLERTAQLEASNVELVHARDAAEAANRAKSAFLAHVSHELRTPLNAVLGFAQLLEGDPDIPEDRRRQISHIRHSGSHLLSLIDNVLEISRIEAGRMVVAGEAFDLSAMLFAIEEIVRVRADAKSLSFSVDRTPELPRAVIGDVVHLRQVLLNLLDNAVRYAGRGHVALHVSTDAQGQLRFEVSDNGPGIAEAERQAIFQPFYRTEAGVANGDGAGLGLTISRKLVQLMGGELSVVSEPGRGSVFAFALPLATPPAGIQAAAAGFAADGLRQAAIDDADCDLGALPGSLRDDLARAARILDADRVRAIAEHLAGQHPREAGAIAGLLARFDFARLENLCQQA